MVEKVVAAISDLEALFSLEPEELAGVLLDVLNSLNPDDNRMTQQNFIGASYLPNYSLDDRQRIQKAVTEAWVWLEREGLLAPEPGSRSRVYITKRGKRLESAIDLETYRKADLLPKRLLHPVIAQKVRSAFLRGDYDTAIFQAFKDVEVAVRSAGNYTDTDIGTSLMRKAFNASDGPLRDSSSPEAEREAIAHLFAGAMGLYKNPQSHRYVQITDPEEAVEIILMASHLMRLVDSRSNLP